jgi:hypothetical protein
LPGRSLGFFCLSLFLLFFCVFCVPFFLFVVVVPLVGPFLSSFVPPSPLWCLPSVGSVFVSLSVVGLRPLLFVASLAGLLS